MPYTVDALRIVFPCLMALVAALLATLAPAEQAVRREPAALLRHE